MGTSCRIQTYKLVSEEKKTSFVFLCNWAESDVQAYSIKVTLCELFKCGRNTRHLAYTPHSYRDRCNAEGFTHFHIIYENYTCSCAGSIIRGNKESRSLDLNS